MAEAWIPWAVRVAPSVGGEDKEGYWGIPRRALDLIEFIVNHDAGGWLAYLLNFHRPGENASWGLFGARDGTLYQGRPLESIPWTSGGIWQNIRGLAIEWEGIPGQPLTPAQVATARRLYAYAATVCSNLGPPVFPGGFREHGELTNGATSCPSGRIQPLYDSYQEDDMALTEEQKRNDPAAAVIRQAVIDVLRAPEFATVAKLKEIKGSLAALDKKVAATAGAGATAGAIVALIGERLVS